MATLQLSRRIRARPAIRGTRIDLTEKLNSLAKAEAEAARAVARYKELQEEMLKDMKAAGVASVVSGPNTAEIVRPSGRSSRTIDVKKFQRKVSAADFYACISVSVTEAKKVLSEKDLNSISTVTEGKPGEETLKFTRKTV